MSPRRSCGYSSRATFTSVVAVCSSSICSDIAQAPLGSTRIVPVPAAAATPAVVTAVVCRNCRRFMPDRLISDLPSRLVLLVSSVPLQHLDLVAVGVLQEEEAGHQSAIAFEFLDRVGCEAELGQPRMLAVEIVDREGDIAVAAAMAVGLGLALVPGQLDLEILLGVAQIDQREAVEIEAVRGLHPERAVVESHRSVQVLHPDHDVDRLGHVRSRLVSSSGESL